MHFGNADSGHIELKDLSEQDFLDLIESKNQDKRFYGWLHYMHEFEHKETNPFDDIEYFRQLYDNDLFDLEDVVNEE